MKAPTHRLVLGAATLLLAVASSARAQHRDPGPSGPTVDVLAALRAAAGPGARFEREGDRVRLASRMRLRLDGASPEAQARALLDRFGPAFGVGAGADLRVERVQRARGFTVVRLRRHAFGAPVLLRSVLVRSLPSGEIDLVVAEPGSAPEDPAPARVGPEALRADAPARVTAWPRARAVEVRAIGLDLDGAIRRGFAVDVEGEGLHRRGLLVYDAEGGLIVGVPRTVHAVGRVYDPNPVLAPATSDVDLPNLTSREWLTGRYVRVSSCGASGARCAPHQTALADAEGNFLYEPEEPVFDDAFAEVNGYFHADRAASYFREQHEFTWSCCGGTTVMEVVVNYSDDPGTPYDNAAYSPSACSRSSCGTILLGQGTGRDFAYDGDVIYHEYTHSVVDETAGIVGFDLDDLGISYEPLGVNEGTADYFAATLGGDPRIAEYFSGTGVIGSSGSLREIDSLVRCPQELFGEGHLDGRVWSGVLWIVREALGAEKADALAYLTLLSMLDNTVFDDAATLLLETADALVAGGVLEAADRTVVEEAIGARGLAGCRRIVPLDDLEAHQGYSGAQFASGSLGGSVAPLHYSLEVPADATKVSLRLRKLTLAGRYTMYLRNGAPLRFVASRRPPLLHDTQVVVEGPVELTEDGAHPLARCQTLYLALIADDLNTNGESVYDLRAEIERSGDPGAECPVAEADAGPGLPDGSAPTGDAGTEPPPGGGGGGGCGCIVAVGASERHTGGGSLLALGLLGLLGRVARRRGRRRIE